MRENLKRNAKIYSSKRENSIPKIHKANHSKSISSPFDQILFLQRTIGNQATQRIMKFGTIQAKLKIGQKNDKYEQEADRVAEQVMRMPDQGVQRQPEEDEDLIQPVPLAARITPLVQRQGEEPSKIKEAVKSNLAIVAKARSRSSGDIGSAYDWTPGWWYSRNKGLDGWRNRPKKWEKKQGAKNPPPAGEGIVNWGDGEFTCLFVYDVLYDAGLEPSLQDNKHYYDASHTYNRKGSLGSYFHLITDPKLVEPGDVMATGGHVEIVASKIIDNSYKAVGTHSDGAYEGEKVYTGGMRFLRVAKEETKKEEGKEPIIQPKSAYDPTFEVGSDIETGIQALRGNGQPLSNPNRIFFEKRFGHNFGQVRIHTDSLAAEAAQAVNARAFTARFEVVFGAGQYAPDTTRGGHLLAHELTHVIQQGHGKSASIMPVQESRLHEEMLLRKIETPAATEVTAEPLETEAPGTKAELSEAVKEEVPQPEEVKESEGEETEKEEKARWTDYTIIAKNAYVRNEPNWKRSNIRRITKIKGNYAYLRKPDDFSPITITDPETAVIPEGTKLVKIKKGEFRLAIRKGTELIQCGDPKVYGRWKYYQVQWRNETGWIREGNTYSVRVSIPVGTKVTIVGSKKVGKYRLARVGWDGQEGWTSYSNISEETWDITYATRFRAKEKLGLETAAPKRTRLRFEDDGRLIAGKVRKQNANKRDANSLNKVLSDELEKDTPCLILEVRGKYYRVLDYSGKWDANSEPPGWWTRNTNIETVPGKINIAEITSNVVRKYVEENQPELTAAETAISVSEIAMTGKLIGHIVKSDAGIRDDMGTLAGGNLPQGVYLVLKKETKTVPQKKGPGKRRNLSKVVKLDDAVGKEYWTRSTYVELRKYEHGYSVDKENGNLYLFMRTKPPDAKHPEPYVEKYEISSAVAKKLGEVYLERVGELIASKKYTKAQEDLLYYAKTFAQNLPHDESKHPKPQNLIPLNKIKPLIIPERAKNQPGDPICLNEDLITRIKRFYLFLRHTNLILYTPPPGAIYGIRSRTHAHQLSTKWNLNPRSGHLKTHEQRLEFANRLVSLGGMPDVANIHWLLTEQVQFLAEALYVIDYPESYKQSWLFPLLRSYTPDELAAVSAFITPASEPVAEEYLQQSYAITDIQALVDELVKMCQENVTLVGNKKIQKAQAAEGFPRSEKWDRRRPNTYDRIGVSNHCGGEAIDITFPFVFNYYDPIIDAIALFFGLYRPVKDSRRSPEHWHYERVGTALGERTEVESTLSPKQAKHLE